MAATTVFLILAPGPVVRAVRKNRPYLERDEAAIKVTIEVPTDFFRRSIPEVVLSIPENAEVIVPDITVSTASEVGDEEPGA